MSIENRIYQDVIKDSRDKAVSIKSSAGRLKNRCIAGTADILLVRNFYDECARLVAFYNDVAAVAGLAAAARSQYNDGTYDFVAHVAAIRTSVIAVMTRLRADVPGRDIAAVNYKAAFNFPADNTLESTVFVVPTAATVNLQLDLQAVIDAVTTRP